MHDTRIYIAQFIVKLFGTTTDDNEEQFMVDREIHVYIHSSNGKSEFIRLGDTSMK